MIPEARFLLESRLSSTVFSEYLVKAFAKFFLVLIALYVPTRTDA